MINISHLREESKRKKQGSGTLDKERGPCCQSRPEGHSQTGAGRPVTKQRAASLAMAGGAHPTPQGLGTLHGAMSAGTPFTRRSRTGERPAFAWFPLATPQLGLGGAAAPLRTRGRGPADAA